MQRIAFDDLETLGARISEHFDPFGPALEVTQAMIDAFADLTGDHQWIHVDAARCARESPFGVPIAHGFLTLSLASQLAFTPDDPWQVVGMGSVVNYGSDRLRFVSPVPVGARIHARKRLRAVDASEHGTRAVREIEVHVVGGGRPALVYEMIVLYRPGL